MQVGIIGSGAIGTDLLAKIMRHHVLELGGIAGIDPASPGLERARALGVTTTSEGLEQLLALAPEIALVLDATSATAHRTHSGVLAERGVRCVDLTPAAMGPAVVPDVNLREHLDAPEVNLVTCGAQATVPIVAAIAAVAEVPYAEIVSTVAARSAGPGTRANIDEFTTATARSLELVGGAQSGKALIVLNPADPPITMRNAVHVRVGAYDEERMRDAILSAVGRVQRFVPGYRLTGDPLFDPDRISVLLEVEGAGDHLPPYAGNLDIMTSAAVRVAEILSLERAPA
ncbi:MAG: acetaldehyde dehydrogenase [Gaiellales bacterium]|nr:acetaldehyde dehydrogenase [Gaiellales bacterium]